NSVGQAEIGTETPFILDKGSIIVLFVVGCLTSTGKRAIDPARVRYIIHKILQAGVYEGASDRSLKNLIHFISLEINPEFHVVSGPLHAKRALELVSVGDSAPG